MRIMEGGNISNVIMEGQTLVNARAFSGTRIELERAWFGLINLVHYYPDIRLVDLARVMRAGSSLPRMILITTDGDQEWCESLYDELNSGYEHPFRTWSTYGSDQELAALLAWMPNTRVIDIPEKAGVYGVRFLELPW